MADNALFLLLAKALDTIFSLVLAITMVRYLGPARYGQYSLIFVFITFFAWISQFGMGSILIREISKEPQEQNQWMATAQGNALWLGALAYGLMALSLFFFSYSLGFKALILLAGIELLLAPLAIRWVLFHVHIEQGYVQLADKLARLLFVASAVTLAMLQADLWTFVLAKTLTTVLRAILILAFSSKYCGYRIQLGGPQAGRLLIMGAPLAFISINTLIYHNIDQLMLYNMLGPTQVGFYAAAVRICNFLNFVPIIFISTVYPVLCQLSSDEHRFERAIERSFRYMMAFIVPSAFIIIVWADNIIGLLYGQTYAASAGVLRWLIVAQVWTFFAYVSGRLVIVLKSERRYAESAFFSALLNIGLNLLLIPFYGVIGAAVATIASYFFVACLYFLLFANLRRHILYGLSGMARPALSAIGVMAVYQMGFENLFLNLSLAVVACALILVLTRAINVSDWRILRQSFRRK